VIRADDARARPHAGRSGRGITDADRRWSVEQQCEFEAAAVEVLDSASPTSRRRGWRWHAAGRVFADAEIMGFCRSTATRRSRWSGVQTKETGAMRLRRSSTDIGNMLIAWQAVRRTDPT
jgi:hypothetical protein